MAQLSSETLKKVLFAALPGATVVDEAEAPKPIVLDAPKLGNIRIYLWTATPDHSQSGRPAGEHKSQIIIPGFPRPALQHFELDDVPTFLLGFSPAFGVFVLWQVERHQNCGYSKNLQVSQRLLEYAASAGWSVAAPRQTNRGPEVRCAVHPAHLEKLLAAALTADEKGIQGRPRQLYFEAVSPGIEDRHLEESLLRGEPVTLDDVQNERRRILQGRLERNSRFPPAVLPLYNFSCCICEVQLHIVEAAHIVPVHDARSIDEPWNGLSLCRNHHRLYDRRIILIDDATFVRSDKEILNIIKKEGHGNGLTHWVDPFLDRPLAVLPENFHSDMTFRTNMKNALALNYSM